MSDAPRSRWSTWEPVSPALTREQTQRVHALRAAREVTEVKPTGGPFVVSGTDFKDYLLLVVAQWIIDGKITPAAEFEMSLDRWAIEAKGGSDG